MEVPFPELTHLVLMGAKTEQVLPNSFLGGSTPRLRLLGLHHIPFPGLPNLLLSATHLVSLYLSDIPQSVYFSPDAIVAVLSTLNSLKYFKLEFRSPPSRPDRRLPPSTRFVLPALTNFWFTGASEYLEDLVGRIIAPRLDSLQITVFDQIIFDTQQFIQFISRTPTLNAPIEAHVIFEDGASRLNISFSSETSGHEFRFLSQTYGTGHFKVYIPCHEDWQDNVENSLWLELLHPFTNVRVFYLSKEFARCIAPALQDLVDGRRIVMLPALDVIFLEGLEASRHVEKGIEQFVAMRQVTSHPITLTRWDTWSRVY